MSTTCSPSYMEDKNNWPENIKLWLLETEQGAVGEVETGWWNLINTCCMYVWQYDTEHTVQLIQINKNCLFLKCLVMIFQT
jgi:sulfur relay (sulfurtransferase) DsrC/TusE family protein